jgi:hypothetical protein
MTLFLVLDRVWADIWGTDFAEEAIVNETGWHRRYAEAWTWARSLTDGERTRLWTELLNLNGFGNCNDLVHRSAGGSNGGTSVADR